ncbi:diguanylate cyclase [Wenzhouxiangella sp. XN24]|uniref:diguanylate cyclase n=1 Tax=Wenzhouxiangella sp. XN24 TaxID=2713569 RepID=UPI0013EB0B00|nr:diguanylate cyclase [Wenzhouxiangella sp. XN24]NGX15863.1 diguanylate cyclase [Wenzhouxiangella sp. XN24]
MPGNDIQTLWPHLLNTDDAGVAIKTLDGRYLFANLGYARFACAELDRITGHTDAEFLAPERVGAVTAAHEEAKIRLDGVNIECAFQTDRGPACYVVTHFPVLDDGRKLVAVGVVAVEAEGALRDHLEAELALKSANQANAQLASEVRNLEELASTDRLTGAWNRRHFETALEAEIHRALRFGHPLSLVMFDIDHFKLVNDNFGHQAGDRVLTEFAACIRSGLRKSDSLTRWGGEEFIVLMPNTPGSAARTAAERFRKMVAAQDFPPFGALTASFGVAQFVEGESIEDLLGRVDAAVYCAKDAGRNRVEVDTTGASLPATAEHVEGHFIKLSWKDSFASGHALIDRQHQGLFDVANEILAAVLSSRPRDEIAEIVERLIADVVQHFKDEEEFLASIGFVELEEHAEEHGRLLDKAQRLSAAFHEDSLGVGELFQFLAYDVVTRHILGADRQYFPYVAGHD